MLAIHSSPVGPLGSAKTGGMSVCVRELARQLGAAGHRVDIFTCAEAAADPQELYPNVRLIRLDDSFASPPPQAQLGQTITTIFERLDRFRRTHRLQYDLVHSHYWIAGAVGALAQAQWRVPHTVMFHTLGAVKNSTPCAENATDLRIMHERSLTASADALITAAPREADYLATFYDADPARIHIIALGVDLALFQPMDPARARRDLGLDPDADILLFVGRFALLKGLDQLISAMAPLRQAHPRALLLIAGGDGPESEATQSLVLRAQRYDVEAAVRFLGRVDHRSLPAQYSAADLVVMPSYYESFGMVPLEALACGTPVAATPVGAMDRIIIDGVNGTLLDNRDARSLAAGIGRLLACKTEMRLRADQIRASIQPYSWPAVAAATLRVYLDLVACRTDDKKDQ